MKPKKLPKNVVHIKTAPKARYVRRRIEAEDQTHCTNTIRVRDSIGKIDDDKLIAFDELPVTAYFLHSCEVSDDLSCPSGIYMKISDKKAILVLDACDARVMMLEDEEYGTIGEVVKFDEELVLPINSELHLS